MSTKMYLELIEARRGRPRKNPLPDNNKGSQGETEDSADKNIIMQMRKVVSLRGQKPVEFDDGNKVDIPVNHAQKAIEKFSKIRTPIDKQEFTNNISKSHSHFKKHVLGEDAIVEDETINESMDVHVVRLDKKRPGHPGQGNKPLYRVHKVGSSVDGVKVGEHITDSEMDDLHDMGHKVKEVQLKPRKPRTMKEQLEDLSEAMPSSVIKHKQSLVNLSDEEFKAKHGNKTAEQLRVMARRHGYSNENHYINRVSKMNEDVSPVVEGAQKFIYYPVVYQHKNSFNRIVEASTLVHAMSPEHALYVAQQRLGPSAKLVEEHDIKVGDLVHQIGRPEKKYKVFGVQGNNLSVGEKRDRGYGGTENFHVSKVKKAV
jgi:hypothetical protein